MALNVFNYLFHGKSEEWMQENFNIKQSYLKQVWRKEQYQYIDEYSGYLVVVSKIY